MIDTLLKPDLTAVLRSQLEIELLLACSRTKVAPELEAKIQLLVRQKLDWKHLFAMAARHQLVPLVYHNLSSICKDDVPAQILAQMRNIYVYRVQTNMFNTAELIKIHRLFQEHGIFAIPFKGMTLAMTAYQNLSFRESCDIDLLISRDDFPQATELLSTLGYEMHGYIAEVKDNPEVRYGSFLQSENNQKGYDFYNPGNKLAIDLQWSVTVKAQSHYFNIDFELFKQNAGEVSLAGNKLPQFAPEVMVLYLCFHGSKHCWQSLKWVCDLSEFIRSHPDLDWQQLEQQARELNLTTMFHLGLLLAHNFYQAPISESLLAKIEQNRRANVLFEQVQQLIFTRPFTQWEDYGFIFKLTDSWQGKLRFLSSLLFTPTMKEWEAVKLPSFLFPLYHVIRPYLLTKQYLNRSNRKNTVAK